MQQLSFQYSQLYQNASAPSCLYCISLLMPDTEPVPEVLHQQPLTLFESAFPSFVHDLPKSDTKMHPCF